jgi:hypothetical protein
MILIEIAADIIDLKACAGQDGWLERLERAGPPDLEGADQWLRLGG